MEEKANIRPAEESNNTADKNNDRTISENRSFFEGFIHNLRTDAGFRWKFFTATSLLWAFGVLGWITGQLGPSFLDLRIITGASLDEGSLYFTFNAGGYLLGSLLAGIIYDKVVYDKTLVISLLIVGGAAIQFALPWCTFHALMVFGHALKGTFNGGFETCGTAQLMHVCGDENASLMQALYFAYAIGGIISPYAIAPFLAEEKDDNSTSIHLMMTTSLPNVTSDYSTISRDISSLDMPIDIARTTTGMHQNVTVKPPPVQESRLYIGYIITSLLILSSAIPFCIMFLKTKCKREVKKKSSEDKKATRKHSRPKLITLIIIMSIIMGLYCGIEDAFNNYLATFCVEELQWTKVTAAVGTSVYWASLAVGRFLGILFINRFKPSRSATVLFSLFSLSHLGFLLFAQFRYDIGVWIFDICVGLSSSVLFPLLFTWMEDAIIPVTGRVASILMISSSAGATINPILLGYTMDNFTPMCLSYTLVSQTALCVFLCCIVLLNTRNAQHTDKEVDSPETQALRTLDVDETPS